MKTVPALVVALLLSSHQMWCYAAEQSSAAAIVGNPALVDLVKRAVPSADGIALVRDIPYIPGDKKCLGDLYLPPGYKDQTKTFPVIMVVHGGAWVLGSKLDPGEVDVAHRMAEDGYVVWNVNYRLVQDGGTWPNSMNDVMDALAFLKLHADDLRIDFNRFGIFGGSAGSQMALLAAYAPPQGAPFKPVHYPNVTLPKAKVAVAYGTISDLRPLEYTWVIHYMDDTPWHAQDVYAQASPICYVQTAVPTLCVHADHDDTVPIDQSKELVNALKQQGIKTDLVVIPKSRHVFHEAAGPKRELAFARLKDFFDTALK